MLHFYSFKTRATYTVFGVKPGSQRWSVCVLRDWEVTLMSSVNIGDVNEPSTTAITLALTKTCSERAVWICLRKYCLTEEVLAKSQVFVTTTHAHNG